ncbi:MAG: YaeQ family protein [Betaproteobacteria bacterium]|nr:YaeQ family protein [Betaproteobacteria bacterium]
MALKSTICKATLQVADMDRHYYADHALTIARHPSETDERMMIRCLAFALNAGESLEFGRGLSDADQADLWQRDLTGSIGLWIEVGQPDEKRILRACGRADRVLVYAYSHSAALWWKPLAPRLERTRNLTVIAIAAPVSAALAKLAGRAMDLQCTLHEGEIWMRDKNSAVQVELRTLLAPPVR